MPGEAGNNPVSAPPCSSAAPEFLDRALIAFGRRPCCSRTSVPSPVQRLRYHQRCVGRIGARITHGCCPPPGRCAGPARCGPRYRGSVVLRVLSAGGDPGSLQPTTKPGVSKTRDEYPATGSGTRRTWPEVQRRRTADTFPATLHLTTPRRHCLYRFRARRPGEAPTIIDQGGIHESAGTSSVASSARAMLSWANKGTRAGAGLALGPNLQVSRSFPRAAAPGRRGPAARSGRRACCRHSSRQRRLAREAACAQRYRHAPSSLQRVASTTPTRSASRSAAGVLHRHRPARTACALRGMAEWTTSGCATWS